MSNHDDAAFVRNFSLLLGGLCVIGLGAFILAKIVSDMHAIDHDAVAAKSRTAPVGAINSGSEPITVTTPLSAAAGPGASSAAAPVASGDLGKSTYDQLCFACHAQGIAGAPKYGDAAAWEARIATGRETLVKHAIEGYTGTAGVMPPKGGNPALSDEAIGAAVDYMTGGTGGNAPSAETAVETAPAAPDAVAAAPAASGKGKETYDAVCYVCHTPGVAGAPKIGDAAAWAPRIEKGIEVLYQSSLTGFMGTGGMMPPKGGRPDIADDDIRAAVDYMVSTAK